MPPIPHSAHGWQRRARCQPAVSWRKEARPTWSGSTRQPGGSGNPQRQGEGQGYPTHPHAPTVPSCGSQRDNGSPPGGRLTTPHTAGAPMPRYHQGRDYRERIRPAVLERDRWICQMPRCLCPSREILRVPRWHTDPLSASVDMILPRSQGGSDRDLGNLRAAHVRCNSSRGDGTRNHRHRYTTTAPRVGGGGTTC